MNNKVKSKNDLRKIGMLGYDTHGYGSIHYKNKADIEPIDLMAANDLLEDFCLGNIIKYATRFKKTKNIQDLIKIVDYAYLVYGYNHILYGYKHKEKDDNKKEE